MVNGVEAGQLASSYAERKSRFMRWLSKLFKSGASGRGVIGGQHPQFLVGEENMVRRAQPKSLVIAPFSSIHSCLLLFMILLQLCVQHHHPPYFNLYE